MREHIPLWSYLLDGIGAFGLLVGGYIASKSVYARQNAKDAALLIDTQRKRIDSLLEDLKELKQDRDSLHAQFNNMQGQLESYKELRTVDPEIITKLLSTQNEILKVLKARK